MTVFFKALFFVKTLQSTVYLAKNSKRLTLIYDKELFLSNFAEKKTS